MAGKYFWKKEIDGREREFVFSIGYQRRKRYWHYIGWQSLDFQDALAILFEAANLNWAWSDNTFEGLGFSRREGSYWGGTEEDTYYCYICSDYKDTGSIVIQFNKLNKTWRIDGGYGDLDAEVAMAIAKHYIEQGWVQPEEV